ncbi:UNVERIFIED_CONTAM: hypothetical protein Sangu_2810400 [Sesamum angustifolium]|uniref:RNase H type-1 domain-containing protein n=1 Tax=Sesamum angustifolium TaxID=2727405 RepID=A0AAW2ISE8_9LAMI
MRRPHLGLSSIQTAPPLGIQAWQERQASLGIRQAMIILLISLHWAQGTSVLAELTAVSRGMELALTHGLAPLVVEVDATTVISLLHSRASGKWEVQHMIMRIVCLQQLLVADVQHVFREANGAADHLAKETASLQLTRVLHHDDIKGVLRGILCLDRQGVPHLRQG